MVKIKNEVSTASLGTLGSKLKLLKAMDARKQALKFRAQIDKSTNERRRTRIIKAIQNAILRGLTEISLSRHKVDKDHEKWLISKGYKVNIVHPRYKPDFKAIISWDMVD